MADQEWASSIANRLNRMVPGSAEAVRDGIWFIRITHNNLAGDYDLEEAEWLVGYITEAHVNATNKAWNTSNHDSF